MNTVQKMRAALAGEITVRTWWGCPGLPASFPLLVPGSPYGEDQPPRPPAMAALTPDYQARLYRDARRLQGLAASHHPPAIRDRHLSITGSATC